MRRIPVKRIKSGMKLARPVFSSDGRFLLSCGTVLKKSFIEKLQALCVNEVYIEDNISEDILIHEIISEETRLQARVAVKKVMNDIAVNEYVDIAPVNDIVNKIVDDLVYNRNILFNLQDIKSIDDYTFSHLVNVCVLSLITGISLGYNQVKLNRLGVGALLHDIGKVKVPEYIINKPDSLNYFELEKAKKHTEYGHEILKKNPEIAYTSRFIALAHHERYDGTGYPLGLKGVDIHEFVRIVSIADVYDAITSDRTYKKRVSRNDALEYLMAMVDRQFDYEIVKVFIRNIPVYPLGSIVLLSTGDKGIVVKAHKNFTTRPVVRVIKDSMGKLYRKYKEIDLRNINSITIKAVCEDI